MSEVHSVQEFVTTLRHWPARRWVAAALLTVPLLWAHLLVGPLGGAWWAVPGALVCGVLAALVLASYVPLPGSRQLIDVGCTPCSTVAFATVIGSLMMRGSDPLAPGMTLLAVVALAFGLVQRLSGGVCAVPGRPVRPVVVGGAGGSEPTGAAPGGGGVPASRGVDPGDQDVVAPTV